jgi:hypothetical protein
MKLLSIIPLLFLVACSTSKPPKIALRPQEPLATVNDHSLRYPEGTRAYHVGRYADPNNDLLMHEQHVVYRVEAKSRWNFHPGPDGYVAGTVSPLRDPAFAPLPVNDAILAEVNAQKAATTAVINQAQQLSGALGQFQNALSQTKANLQETAALRAAVAELGKRLELLEASQKSISVPADPPTNPSPDP